MEMKSIKIHEDLHKIVAIYCKFKGKSIVEYIEELIEQDEKLKKFQSEIKKMSKF